MDIYEHLLSMRGMTWDSSVMVEFMDHNLGTIAIKPVTAREGWDFSFGGWNLASIADGPTARKLGASVVALA